MSTDIRPTTVKVERIGLHGVEWICLCGNEPHGVGFHTCASNGDFVQPTPQDWGDLYRCDGCGRIVHESRYVVGYCDLTKVKP
jgi:hypothetical protein